MKLKKRMKLSAMTVFFAMLLGFAVMCIGTEQAFAVEWNERDNRYEISNYNDLKDFADIVNGTHTTIAQNTSACAILTADIDATGNSDWIPIGNDFDPYHLDPEGIYLGMFDGQGHTITGLSTADGYSGPGVGLFGGSSGVIKNVGIVNNNFSNNYDMPTSVQGTGGVVGYNEGTVENCYNTGAVSGRDYVGGVAGTNYKGTIENCYNTGSVSGANEVGGVAGKNLGTIEGCYNTGAVSGSGYNVGGSVSESGNFVGGVAGYNDNGTIANCYNTGAVSGETDVGGVAGYNYWGGTIKSCYNTGDVSGSGDDVGGVAGFNHTYGTVTNCFSIGDVKGNGRVGGVAGWNNNGTVTNCYYDSELCKDKKAIGTADDTDNVKGLTTEQMTGDGALNNMVFESVDPWLVKTNDENAKYYPHLKGFNFDDEGKQMAAEDISADYWPPKVLVSHSWEASTFRGDPVEGKKAGESGYIKFRFNYKCTCGNPGSYEVHDDAHWTFLETTDECKIELSTNPSCTKDGIYTYWFKGTGLDGNNYDKGIETPAPATGHKYGAWTNLDDRQHKRVCEHDATHVEKANHTWDAGTVTKAATKDVEGMKTYTCTVCKATKTETIPKLKLSGTPTAKMSAGKTSITMAWSKIQGVDGYDIFFAQCNHNKKKIVCKNVKTIEGNNIFTWKKSGLKKGTAYKSYVKAYVMKNGKKTYVKTSPMMHAYTGNGTKKYTNAKSVTVKKAKISLKKGKTYKIKASVKKMKKNKKLMPKSHVATLRYLTSNSKVATVSKSGKITAKGKGSCVIYVFAHNGVSKQVKVTVN